MTASNQTWVPPQNFTYSTPSNSSVNITIDGFVDTNSTYQPFDDYVSQMINTEGNTTNFGATPADSLRSLYNHTLYSLDNGTLTPVKGNFTNLTMNDCEVLYDDYITFDDSVQHMLGTLRYDLVEEMVLVDLLRFRRLHNCYSSVATNGVQLACLGGSLTTFKINADSIFDNLSMNNTAAVQRGLAIVQKSASDMDYCVN